MMSDDKDPRAAAKDKEQTSNKPQIKSLLDIDPWRDVPGYCENVEPPLKQLKLDKSSSSQQQTEVKKLPVTDKELRETEEEKLSRTSQNTIPSLFDINPFKVNILTPETNSSPETDEEVDSDRTENRPISSDDISSESHKSVSENTSQTSGPKHVPSLFDIDPFGGREPLIPRQGMQLPSVLPTRMPKDKPVVHKTKTKVHDPEKVALLHTFICAFDVEKVEELLALGVNVDAPGQDGRSALAVAVNVEQLALSEMLLTAGASVDLRDARGSTPLLSLASKSQDDLGPRLLKIAAVLIRHKASCEVVNSEGFNALHLSSKNGTTELTRLVLPHSNVNTTTLDGSTPLHIATKHCHGDIAELLLRAGADPNIQDTASETPLIIAARGGCIDIIEKLLNAGCDVNLKGFMEYTALHWAVHSGYKNVTELLLRHGVAFDAQSALGRSPLHRAVGAGHVDIAEMLILAGADIELIDGNGETPLTTATRFGFLEIVRLLLKHNANPDPPCPQAKTPLVKAILLGFKKIAELLMSVDCDRSLLGLLANDLLCKGNLSWLAMKENMRAFLCEHQHKVNEPRQLKQLCRYHIRQQLRSNHAPVGHVQLLPVPEFLKSYITLDSELSAETPSS